MPQKKKKPYQSSSASKELLFKDDDQYYAHVLRALGDRRFAILTDEGIEMVGKLRGSMRRREYVSPGCVVLCSLRPEEGGKSDILHKYTDQHVKLLRKYGELGELSKQVATYNKENDIVPGDADMEDDLVQFEDADIDDIIEHV